MYLLINSNNEIQAASDLNLWDGRVPERFSIIEYDGAFPDWPGWTSPGEPQWYVWDGTAPVPRVGFEAPYPEGKPEVAAMLADPIVKALSELVRRLTNEHRAASGATTAKTAEDVETMLREVLGGN